MSFAGGMVPNVTIFFLNTIISAAVTMVLLYVCLLPYKSPEWTVWLASYFAFGMGAGLGVGAIRWPKFGVLSLGATIGYIIGMLFDLVII